MHGHHADRLVDTNGHNQPQLEPRVVYEVDGYERTIPGFQIEAVKTGVGPRPTEIRTAASSQMVGAAVDVGFPMMSRTTMGDDTVVIASIMRSAPQASWCGHDLAVGDVFVYTPGALHTAFNVPGICFVFAAFRRDVLEEAASRSDRCVDLPPDRTVTRIPARAENLGLGPLLLGYVDGRIDEGKVQRRMLGTFSTGPSTARPGPARIDDASIIRRCISLAERRGLPPRVSELPAVAWASERRVRYAFEHTYGISPTEFFRRWQMDRARRLLLDPLGPQTVSDVASEVGAFHFGRFSGRYEAQFGELPSATLQWRRHAS